MAGRLVVGVNELVGQSSRSDYFIGDRYSWLRNHFQPVASITPSFLEFDVSEEELISLYDGSATMREMQQRFPPWIEAGEPLPELTLDVLPNPAGPAVLGVRVRVTSRTELTRPWNVWLETVTANGVRSLASRVHLVRVDSNTAGEITAEVRVREGVTLRAWLGVFPDRYVTQAETKIRLP